MSRTASLTISSARSGDISARDALVRPFVRHYDTLFADKDYDSDVVTLATLTGAGATSRVLELGAGTGSHSHRLGRFCREVVSVEIDADFHSACAARLQAADSRNVTLYATPVEELPETGFDVAAAFFHVLNYIPPAARAGFVGAIGERLVAGGRFLADLWHAEAVERDPPREETRTKRAGGVRLLQRISPRYVPGGAEVELDYSFEVEAPGRPVERFDERLRLHLWTRPALEATFRAAGFSHIEFRDWRDSRRAAGSVSWRVWLYARKS